MGWRNLLLAPLRLARSALGRLRGRGVGAAKALLIQLPAAAALRAWRALAQPLSAAVLLPMLSRRRFIAFQDRLPAVEGLRLYLIVMPHTLHFLLPCLAQLQGRAPLVLIANGAKAWELELLRQRLPDVPLFKLLTLAAAPMPHGAVLSLLLRHHRGDFAIVDHDAYCFAPDLWQRLQPREGECMVASFWQDSQGTGIRYPLTHVLAFRAQALSDLMQRYRIDAGSYRQAPRRVRPLFQRLGLGPRSWLKDYHRYFDTLHVLLVAALAEGMMVRFVAAEDEHPVLHVGGTSIGSHHTKDLFALYTHLRFLELAGDPQLMRRYAFLTHPLRLAGEALVRRRPGDPAWQGQPVVDRLMRLLAASSSATA